MEEGLLRQPGCAQSTRSHMQDHLKNAPSPYVLLNETRVLLELATPNELRQYYMYMNVEVLVHVQSNAYETLGCTYLYFERVYKYIGLHIFIE